MHTSPLSRWTTVATVCLLAAIAAVVSYAHMFELALRHGEPAWRAGLFPLSVDGMIVAASMSLLSDARQGRRGGALPWILLIVGSAASLAANVAVADPTVVAGDPRLAELRLDGRLRAAHASFPRGRPRRRHGLRRRGAAR
ncbi:DUF2637 domain-containing protein [Streptomonospora alba]|uniref:DUF2637 domain-containing protein n=1 Tax=Streptomonospora alba TaxID=183763 RepID=UPI000B1852CA|nr:DUF2637 domain-containing protein [Streptomonospora alba]